MASWAQAFKDPDLYVLGAMPEQPAAQSLASKGARGIDISSGAMHSGNSASHVFIIYTMAASVSAVQLLLHEVPEKAAQYERVATPRRLSQVFRGVYPKFPA